MKQLRWPNPVSINHNFVRPTVICFLNFLQTACTLVSPCPPVTSSMLASSLATVPSLQMSSSSVVLQALRLRNYKMWPSRTKITCETTLNNINRPKSSRVGPQSRFLGLVSFCSVNSTSRIEIYIGDHLFVKFYMVQCHVLDSSLLDSSILDRSS